MLGAHEYISTLQHVYVGPEALLHVHAEKKTAAVL